MARCTHRCTRLPRDWCFGIADTLVQWRAAAGAGEIGVSFAEARHDPGTGFHSQRTARSAWLRPFHLAYEGAVAAPAPPSAAANDRDGRVPRAGERLCRNWRHARWRRADGAAATPCGPARFPARALDRGPHH